MSKNPFKRNLERVVPVDLSWNRENYKSYKEISAENIFKENNTIDSSNNKQEELFLNERQIKDRKNQTANDILKNKKERKIRSTSYYRNFKKKK